MSPALFDVRDRVIVITGGLGRLGRVYTACFAELGARVAVLDRAVADSTAADAANTICVACDVTQHASVQRALSQVVSKWGVPHALINNAALDAPPDAPVEENGPFESYPEASWDRMMEVNAKGVFICCQVIGGAMAVAGRGSIINVSSIYGLVSPDQRVYDYRRRGGSQFYKPVAYSASKSSLFNLTRYLATYWATRGVRVNTLTLGGVASGQDEEFVSSYVRRVPLGRMASAEEYNGPVVFLCSDASSYMTGANLVVDGGWTAW
jgi:NAD(P)-dependent dehydrogenase (short-subunit alcohol dehydrogenase family)